VEVWQIVGLLVGFVVGLIGLLYHLHDRRLRDLEVWRDELPEELQQKREHYLKEIALTYARKDAFERVEAAMQANHQELGRRLQTMDERLLQVVEIALMVKGLKDELGDHDSGLRGQVHEQRRQLVQLAGKVPGGLEVFT
jgi:hypothetical protein